MQDENNAEIGFVKQILSLNLVPRKNATKCGSNDTSLCDFSGERFHATTEITLIADKIVIMQLWCVSCCATNGRQAYGQLMG